MNLRMKPLAVLLAMLVMVAPGFSQKKSTTDKVLFTVDGKDVRMSEFLYLYKKNNQSKESQTSKKNVQEYLDLVVAFKIKVAEAHSRGLDTTQAFAKEFATYREELKKPFIASEDELGRLVKEAYSRMQEEVKAAHILVSVSPDAAPADTLAMHNKIMGIRDRVLKGEDFAKLAVELSDDPTARQNEGMLGYFTAMQMVYQFEDAAYNTSTGEVSMPVRTRFGYHIIKVYDRRKASGEVEVAHILFGGTDQKSRSRAFEAYDQLKGGRPWESICKEYSEDTNTKERGGKLPPFGVGALANVPEFEAMAFSMQQVGEISDPFQSAIGWHIIRLERKLPVPAFADIEATLKRRIGRDERLQVKQTAQLNRRKAQVGFQENAANKSRLIEAADSTLQQGKWQTAPLSDVKASPLFTLDQKVVSVKEFLDFVSQNQRPSALSPQAYCRQLYDKFVELNLSDVEDIRLQKENVEYRNLVNEYKEGILFFSIMEKEVWNKASADTVGQRTWYEANKQRYQAGDRLYARLFSTNDKKFLEQMKEKIAKGDSISKDEARKFKAITPFRVFGRGENKAIDMIQWATGIHDAEADGMYYLVEVERLIPPGTKSFQEARAAIITDYQEELEKKWLESLKKKHSVKVTRKAVDLVIKELSKNA